MENTLTPLERKLMERYHAAQEGRIPYAAYVDFAQSILSKESEPPGGTLREADFLRQSDIALSRHARYLPPIAHAHEFFEMACVLSGRFINSMQDAVYELEAGDFHIIPPGVSHAICTIDPDGIALNILVSRQTFLKAFQGLIRQEDAFSDFFLQSLIRKGASTSILARTGGGLNEWLERMWLEQQRQDDALSSRILNSYFQLLIALILRSGDIQVSTRAQAQPLLPILRCIDRECDTITLAELAGRFGYSPEHLSRLIKRHTNAGFHPLRTAARMQKASLLLQESALPVEEIARLCGYAGKSNFYHMFLRHFGQTPSVHRASARDEASMELRPIPPKGHNPP